MSASLAGLAKLAARWRRRFPTPGASEGAILRTNGALLFQHYVSSFPKRDAFVFPDVGDERRVTYAEFDDAMHRIASGLSHLSLESGARVLISAAPGPDVIEAIYGTVRAGLTAVLCDPAMPPAVAAAFAEEHGCVAAVTDRAELAPLFPAELAKRTFGIGEGDGPRFSELRGAARRPDLPTEVPDRHPAVAFATSGSTGRPKLIFKTHEHFHLLSRYRSSKYTSFAGIEEETVGRYLVATSLNHTSGLNAGVMLGLLRGWTGVVLNSFRPSRVLLMLALQGCTTVVLTPSQAASLLRESDLMRALNFSALQSIRVGSGPSAPGTLRRLQDAMPGMEILNIYALTECAPCLGQPPATKQPLESCGRPWAGVEARILDDEGREVTEGELWIKSDLISEGTILDTRTQAERYVDGWLRTRDIFRLDEEGWYHFVGRMDDMFVCGGENVFPGDVERLLAQHPDVVDVCVAGLPDDALGAVAGAVAATRPGSTTSAADLLEYMRGVAAVYLVPSRLEIVAEVPTLGPGKVNRRAVRELLTGEAGPAPVTARAGGEHRDRIAAAWHDVLSAAPVGDHGLSFLDAGGTSATALQLINQLAVTGVRVGVADLLDDGSIEALVRLADEQERSAPAPAKARR